MVGATCTIVSRTCLPGPDPSFFGVTVLDPRFGVADPLPLAGNALSVPLGVLDRDLELREIETMAPELRRERGGSSVTQLRGELRIRGEPSGKNVCSMGVVS